MDGGGDWAGRADGFGARGEAKFGRRGEAEHVAEGADDAAGLGGGAEEFGGVRAGEEDVQPVGVAGGGVADGGDEPGLAAGEAGFGGSRAGRARAGAGCRPARG